MTKIYSGAPQMARASESERNVEITSGAAKEVFSIDNYAHMSSSVRELVSNAVTAVKKAEQAGQIGAGEGLVTVRADGRDLAISDNGIGITADAFRNALRVYGNTTNDDRTVSGIFGAGFFSYRLLGKRCTIESMTRDGAGFRALCTGGSEFKILDGRPEAPGTTITVHMDGAEAIPGRCADAVNYIADLCTYCDVPVRVEHGDRFAGLYRPHSVRDTAAELKRYSPESFYYGDDELEAAFDPANVRDLADGKTHLIGMPIVFGELLPCYAVINIKNESAYTPMPSKDRLTRAAGLALRRRIDVILGKELARAASITSQQEYQASEHKAKFRLITTNTTYSVNSDDQIVGHNNYAKRVGLSMLAGYDRIAMLVIQCFKTSRGRTRLVDVLDRNLAYCECGKSHRIPGRTRLMPDCGWTEIRPGEIARAWGIPPCGGPAQGARDGPEGEVGPAGPSAPR